MRALSYLTAAELQIILGERLRRIRLAQNLDQRTVAEKAGISEKSVRNIEAGRGSSVETLLRVLKALGHIDALDMLAPEPSVDPMALLRQPKPPQRASHSRVKKEKP